MTYSVFLSHLSGLTVAGVEVAAPRRAFSRLGMPPAT
jgi:hypothetical protein